jgi:hypothetical protein
MALTELTAGTAAPVTQPTWRQEVLTLADRARWTTLVESVSGHDAFFLPAYVEAFARYSGEEARLFFFGNDYEYIVYPFLLRQVSDLPFYQTLAGQGAPDYFDIVSPYGYSGPLARIQNVRNAQELWQAYLSAFHSFCVDSNIVCEFGRLNPFVGNQIPLLALTDGVQRSGEIVFVDLRQSEEDIWRGFNRGNRSNIKKAQRMGVTVEERRDDEAIAAFYRLYRETMERNNARPWYYFSPEFMQSLFTGLGSRLRLFCAVHEGIIIAAATYLCVGKVCHYFLGGSCRDYFALRPNNLLMKTAIMWAKSNGYVHFNLGGRHSAHDNLGQFKSAFAKTTATFYTYRVVHMPEAYQTLCQQFKTYTEKAGHAPGNGDYFPLYRG